MYLPKDIWARFETDELRWYQHRMRDQLRAIDNFIDRRSRTSERALKALGRRQGDGHAWPQDIRDAETTARAIAVMRLAGRGWPNKRIGAKIGIHPGSVSRIVQKQLRALKASHVVTERGLEPRTASRRSGTPPRRRSA